MWHSVEVAPPFDYDLQLAVIDHEGGVHALVFPCRRADDGWVDARTGAVVSVWPSHWRLWSETGERQES
jgi:hypothetical protein